MSTKLKILLIATQPERAEGGETVVAYDSMRLLKDIFEVGILYPDLKNKVEIIDGVRKISVAGGETKGIVLPDLNPLNIEFVRKEFKKFSPDIIHSHTILHFAPLIQVWALRKNIPFLYTAHYLPSKIDEWLRVISMPKIGREFGAATTKEYLKRFYDGCSVLFCLNKGAMEDLKIFGVGDETELILLPNYLRLQQKPILRKHINNGKVKLVYAGGLSSRKNQAYLASMMKFLPENYILYLLGGAYDDFYLAEVKKQAQKSGAEDRIILTGNVNREEVFEHYKNANVFVSASIAEVQSLAVLEALSFSLPVVGLSNTTIDELINNKNGFRLPIDTDEKNFAKKVQEVVAEPEKYSLMQREAFETSKRFSGETHLEKLNKVYTDLTGKKVNKKAQKILVVSIISVVISTIAANIFRLLGLFRKK